MTQTILVFIILGVAIIASAYLLYRHWTKPNECSKYSGCKDCPLLDACNKTSKVKEIPHESAQDNQ